MFIIKYGYVYLIYFFIYLFIYSLWRDNYVQLISKCPCSQAADFLVVTSLRNTRLDLFSYLSLCLLDVIVLPDLLFSNISRDIAMPTGCNCFYLICCFSIFQAFKQILFFLDSLHLRCESCSRLYSNLVFGKNISKTVIT